MISFASLTKSAYEALSQPVADRIYYLVDTGEQFLNGLPYDGEDRRDYLCFTAVTAGATVALDKSSSSMADIDLEYSTDKRTWTKYTWDSSTGEGDEIALESIGDKVFFRGDNSYLNSSSAYFYFSQTGTANPSGNIMSIVDKTCESLEIPDTGGRFFTYLFGSENGQNTSITDISGLRFPATKLAESCYQLMFISCTSLVDARIDLPAPVLATNCYKQMFVSCRSLVYPPELPALVLANGCYDKMFTLCSSLSRAPKLPAPILVTNCYKAMFSQTAVTEVEVAFTDWLNGTATGSSWMLNVPAAGTFKCPAALDTSIRDESHIPSGWSVVYTDIPEGKVLPSSTSTDEGKVLTVNSSGNPEWDTAQGDGGGLPDYLNFQAGNAFTVKLAKVGSPDPVSLEYSLDRQTWTAFSPDETLSFSQTWKPVYIRGDNAAFSKDTSNYYKFVFSGSNPYIYGNVMSLIDKSCASTTVPNYCFPYLFSVSGNDAKIQSFQAILPATVLGQYCYSFMFDGQSGSNTFNQPVVLPATKLVIECYSYMFNGCFSLNSVVLHCSNNPPVRFAVYGMFSGCSKLQTLICPNLNGSYLGSYYTSNWMNNAGSSADSPRCFYCLQAETITTRGADTVPSNWTIYSLSASPDALVPSSTSTDEGKVLTVDSTGTPAWEEPQGEREIPDYFCITALAANSGVALNKYSYTSDTSSLVATLEYSTDGETWTSYTWTGDAGQTITLANVGDKVYFRGNNATFSTDYDKDIYYRFDPVGQSAALAVSGNIMSLLDKTMQSTTVPDYAFFNLLRGSAKWLSCEDLRLPATTLGAYCYYYMFRDDTGITAIPKEIARYEEPAQGNRKMYVFGGMFRGCTGLTSVKIDFMPKIQTSYGFGEFDYLFRSCWNLTEITVDFTQWSPSAMYETNNWLYDVPASGVFRCPGTLDTSTRDASHIPAGWSVIYTDVPEGKVYPGTLDDEPCWIENASGLPRPSETFTISSKGGWQGIVEYSYNKTDWTSVVFDGTQADGPVATPAWKTGRVWLRKNGPNWGSKYAIIQGATIYRIGGNLASMNTAYSGTAIDSEFMRLFSSWDPTSGSSTPTYLTSNLHDISELRIPHRPLGPNAMTWCFEHHQYYLAETCPMPIAYSQRGSDNTTWVTGSWYQSFWGCTGLSLIRLLQDPVTNYSADRNNGFYSIVDNTIYGLIWVEKGAGFIKVNPTDLVPGGHFSAATEGSPVSACVIPRETLLPLNPLAPYIPQYTVASGVSMTLTISSSYMQTLSGGQNMLYGEAIIDCDASGSVYLDATYFSSDSDSVTPGKRNWCVYRVLGGSAKLYIVDTQDLPSA